MCRFLAYLGPDVSLDALLLQPPHSLLRQTWEPRYQRRGQVNVDGFGVGWYDFSARPEPALYRRACPMWADRSFASIAGVVRSGAVLGSVRDATPPSPIEETCTAPFASGPWLFAHNGEVKGFRTGGRGVLLGQLSDRRAAEIESSADSEVLFAMVLDRLDAGAGPPEALQAVVETVLTLTGGRLNMVLTNGHAVAATACGDSLFLLQPQDPAAGCVVASEPYDDAPEWRAVPDGSVVQADAGRSARIEAMSR